MTIEGPPVSERNWACKHLAALAKTFTSWDLPGNGSPPGGPQPGHASTPVTNVTVEDWSKGEGRRKAGVEGECQGTVIEDSWSESDPNEGEDNREGERTTNINHPFILDYKLPHDYHGLAHLLKPRPDGSLPPASSPDPPSVTPDLLSLQQELQRDPEAQMLAGSVQGCILRRCLLREGKGGVHVCNYGQARLEGNVFRGLNYAVRCIQNASVIMIRVIILILSRVM